MIETDLQAALAGRPFFAHFPTLNMNVYLFGLVKCDESCYNGFISRKRANIPEHYPASIRTSFDYEVN